jgi:hypothetical protein
MESTPEAPEESQVERRRVRRKHRPFWKRRQLWIGLFAILMAIALVLWLISSIGSHRGEID